MGQSESSSCTKRFVNKPQDIVPDTLQGLLWTNHQICSVGNDRDVKIIALESWVKPRDEGLCNAKTVHRWSTTTADSGKKSMVAVVGGGGAGHEPADIGFVGHGLLTAVVCGEIFTAPPPDSVSRMLLAVVGRKGCLVVIRNHFSTVLAVKAGIRNAQQHKDWPPDAEVKVVAVADDIASSVMRNGQPSFKAARGVAGAALVMKVAGAAAAEGLSLEEVYDEAKAMALVVRTQGVCFNSSSVPGQENLRSMPPDEMEVGCGIHGEVSRMRVKAKTTAKEIIEIMVAQLRNTVDPDAPLVAFVNNLGSVPPNEMLILTNEVMLSDIGDRIKLLIGPAAFVTSLDTNGISLSLAPLQGRAAERLRAPVDCRYWPQAVVPSKPNRLPLKALMREDTLTAYDTSDDDQVLTKLLERLCQAIQANETELNKLDGHYKNGDCGRNLAHAARLVQESISSLPLSCPQDFCNCLAALLRRVEGALMALISTLFFKAGVKIDKKVSWIDTEPLLDGFLWALHEVMVLGEFTEGMRTFADALGPALRAGRESGGNWCTMAEEARKGARATATMSEATGRSAYAEPAIRYGCPDTGAMAVAFMFAILAAPEGKFTRLECDDRLGELYVTEATIGIGGFGQVVRARRCSDDAQVAIKASARFGEAGLRSFEDLDLVEKQRMKNWLFRPKTSIVNVLEALASPSTVFMVMDLLTGPSLSDWLFDDPEVTERQVASITEQMFQAADAMHSFGLVHRDLKVDNFVFTTTTMLQIKLVDVVGTMSFQTVVASGKKVLCGTGPYLSPEALRAKSLPASDIWALGVTLYLMVTRKYPYRCLSLRGLDREHRQRLKFDTDAWMAISPEGRSFAAGLFAVDPAQRPSARVALQHNWFAICEALPEESFPVVPLMRKMPSLPKDLSAMGLPPGRAHHRLERADSDGKRGDKAVVKTLYLVRHGEALHNIEEKKAKKVAEAQARALGASTIEVVVDAECARKRVLHDATLKDAALSLTGKVMALQAQSTINQLQAEQLYPKPTRIMVSPLERTLQTAALIFPGHPNTHVVEALRERRTGLPCDERKRAREVAQRSTFQYMSFQHLLFSENGYGWDCDDPPEDSPRDEDGDDFDDFDDFSGTATEKVEDKKDLRARADLLLKTLPDYDDDTIALVTHKGFLRELERGPLDREDAPEFGNCEVRVFEVTFPLDGKRPIAHLRYGP